MGGPDLLCVGSGKEAQEVLKRMEREATFSYQTLTLPEDTAANVLYLNGTLVHRSIEEIPLSFKVMIIFQFYLRFYIYCDFLGIRRQNRLSETFGERVPTGRSILRINVKLYTSPKIQAYKKSIIYNLKP